MVLPQAIRRIASAIFAASTLSLASGALMAQARLVVPYPPGGSADLSGRIIAQKMSEVLGRQVIVDNRPGGGTLIASEHVAKSAADGMTMLQINPSNIIAQLTIQNSSIDLRRDFVAVSLMASSPLLLVVNPKVPARSLAEFVALAKAQPGMLNFASGGVSGITHLTGELLNSATGIKVVHVPFKGSASTIAPLVSGEVSMAFNDVPTYLPHVRAGRLRALAITGDTRSADLPDIPTMAEAGFPAIDSQAWFVILVPAKTPPGVVGSLAKAIEQVVAQPDVRDRLKAAGMIATASSPQQTAAMMTREFDKWSKLVKEVNLQAR